MATEQKTASGDAPIQLPDREQLKSDATEVMETAKQAGRQRLESGKNRAADQAEKVAGAMEQASVQLQESDLQSLADYAGQVAGTIKSMSENLRNRSVDDLLKETQLLARRNPTLFLLGSVAVGIAISRFLKASAERHQENHPSASWTEAADPSGLPRESQSISDLEPSSYPESPAL